MSDSSTYLVCSPEESRSFGNGASPYVPTFGAPTAAIDQYRTIAVVSTNLPDEGVAFTDVCAVAALARVAEGGITSATELEAAETALQALLLHEIVHVLIPSPKFDAGNGLISYLRQDHNSRTPFGFELFSLAQSHDWLIAPEFVWAKDGIITRSTLSNSSILGHPLAQMQQGFQYSHEEVWEAINVAIESHGVPAYLTDPALIHSRRGDGFSKRFYHQIRQSWNNAVGNIPPIVCTFSLPPLLAIVLDRLNNRADLKSVIHDLRTELAPVRRELRDFNKIVTQSTSNAEIEGRIQHITQSFDAIIPESRLSPTQRRTRRISSIQGLVRPIVKFAMGFATKAGATLEDGLNIAEGTRGLIIENKAFVDRTITAKTFVGLVQTEALQSLVKHHFTQAEIASIEKSIRPRG